MENNVESDQIRDVYAHFGLAYYEACCLEKQIGIVLCGPCAPAHDKMTKERVAELFDTSIEQTFGGLVKELKNRMTLPGDIDKKLNIAVEKRNWLAHYYWWDRASELNSFTGRQYILKELDELRIFFSELDNYFNIIARNWLADKGLGEDIFNTLLNELLSGPTPPRKVKRRLNKVERLVEAYIETDASSKKSMPLFELADHSLWVLCDCGLTYAPDDIELSHLKRDLRFQTALPADIIPRPKNAKLWDYQIPLSTGFYIRVSPYEKEGEFTFNNDLFKSK